MTNKELLISHINLLSEEDIASLSDAVISMETKCALTPKPNCPYCGSHAIMSNSHFPAGIWREEQLPEISSVCLGGVSEFDETFVLDCYKGKSLTNLYQETLANMGQKPKKWAFLMNMCASAQASSVMGMPLLPPSTRQSPVLRNLSVYLMVILQTEPLPFAMGCAVTTHFRELQTIPLRIAITVVQRMPVFIT